jgi:outer membrane lipoprotein SlyB
MRNIQRLSALGASALAVSMLAACSTYPTSTYPVSTAPYPVSSYPTQMVGSEYGRVINVEYMPVGTAAPRNNSIIGAVVGGLAGAALGSTVGGGSGRTAATVLGGVAGAAIGNQVMRNQQGVLTSPGYRITMQSDNGVVRTYEVPSHGDLRVGDRIRVENGVIHRA